MARHRPLDAYELPGRSEDEEHTAVFAAAIDVHAVVGLLFSDVLEGFVLAARHVEGSVYLRILGFGSRRLLGGS